MKGVHRKKRDDNKHQKYHSNDNKKQNAEESENNEIYCKMTRIRQGLISIHVG